MATDAQGWFQSDSINKEHFYKNGYPACGWNFAVNLQFPKVRCSECEAAQAAAKEGAQQS